MKYLLLVDTMRRAQVCLNAMTYNRGYLADEMLNEKN